MKNLSAILGLLCLATTVAVPWFYDWRAGVLVSALTIGWTACGAWLCWQDIRRFQRLEANADRNFAIAKHNQEGWRECEARLATWRYQAIVFAVMTVILWCMGYALAWKLDKLAKNG